MNYFHLLKKATTMFLCIFIGYIAISGIMLAFFSVFAAAVTNPMYYANINFLNCDLYTTSAISDQEYTSSLCQKLNISYDDCTTAGFKKRADALPKENAIKNTGFLVDVVFLTYKENMIKDSCMLYGGSKNYENYFLSKGGYYSMSGTIISPVKQTVSENIAAVQDRSVLSAIEVVVVEWTRSIRNSFEEQCTLTKEQCDQKYYDLYYILSDEILNISGENLKKRNFTDGFTPPSGAPDESQMALNGFLRDSGNKGNWENPVSNFTYILLSETSKGLIHDKGEELIEQQQKVSSNPFPIIVRISPALSQVIEIAKTMLLAEIKTSYLAPAITGLRDKIRVIETPYYDNCLNDEECTKEVFQSKTYQACLPFCEELKNKYIEDNSDNLQCLSSCSGGPCQEDCSMLKQLRKEADTKYASCMPECYRG